jgi:serine/threonine-protein kinase
VRTFGKYKLLEPLASGGMADVFRAELAGAAGVTKEVALKLVRGEHGGDSDFVRMFIQEARLAARLTHANVVQVFEFDQVEGRHYIAMELVRGRNLARVVDRCRELGLRFGLPRAVHVCAEAARGLAYAHRLAGPDGAPLGLVHRDVSPHNLLLSFEGEVKLADFGIARAMGLAGLTAPGTLKGKIAYMAPEQARGEAVDARADVFALGVILWELCAGRRLFARDTDAATLAALLGPEPVSPASGWNESVPPELDEVLRGAVEKDPARRTGSAEDLARALSRILLRVASGPDDWDLRGFMHRLWPEEARPPAAATAEPTRVRPPAAPPMPASPAAGGGADDATRTAPAGPSRRGRRAAVAASLLTAAAAAVALWFRLAAPPSDPRPGDPQAAAASPSTRPSPPRGEGGEGSASPLPAPPQSGDGGKEGSALPAAASPSARPAPPGGREGDEARATSTPAQRAPRIRSAPGAGGLPLPPRSSGDGLVFVNATPWAHLSVDGIALGETPRTVRLPAGSYEFRVQHPKFGVRKERIEVRAGVRKTWTLELAR